MTTALICDAPRGLDLSQVESALFDIFQLARQALNDRRVVVIVVRDDDLLGHGDAADAALAAALVGLVRALATEGTKDDWQINALAVPVRSTSVDGERQDWVERLADPRGATGALVRLGDLHLGRLPV